MPEQKNSAVSTSEEERFEIRKAIIDYLREKGVPGYHLVRTDIELMINDELGNGANRKILDSIRREQKDSSNET